MPGRRGRAAALALALLATVVLAGAACGSTASTNGSGNAQTASSTPGPGASNGSTPGSSTPGSTEPSFTPTPIVWKPCKPDGYDCAVVEVPLDYHKPNATKINLAVKRKPAEDPASRIGSFFFNPGGPGASGLAALPNLINDFAPEVRQRFDVVTWDPRGVGGSAPLSCDRGALEFYALDLSTPHPAPETIDAAKRWAELCKSSNGEQLPFLGTADVTRDLETLRKAVGDEKLTYAGFSYGTLIGLLYAERYPQTVRAILLDGVVDPSLDVKENVLQQSTAVDDAYDRFLAWCKANPGDGPNQCPIAADPEGIISQVIEQARTDPLPGKVGTEVVYLSTTFVNFALTTGTYDADIWPQIGAAIDAASKSDPDKLASLANSYIGAASQSLNAAVNCIDTKPPKGADMQQLVDEAARVAPKLGVYNANSTRICEFWPVAPQPVPAEYHAKGAPMIMVWGTTGDNATPYANALKISDSLENARLVTLEASRHAALGANECVQRLQGTYLVDLEVPPPDTKC